MTCIASTITKYSIYKNKNLEEFILSLEEKYNIKDKIKEYHNLVNFGENLEIPYHRWFKYREGYSAELVRRIINNADISPKEYYILDPFCGSGTTMVVASSLGFSSIGIDVNPSITVTVNKKEKVLDVTANNDDARIILEGMDLAGSDINVAINALIGSMDKNGYICGVKV